ncbi:hypothetical protein [Kitasatospora sp. P5_F3]
MVADPAFADAVSMISAHYPCQGGNGGEAYSCRVDAAALDSGKPLRTGENGSHGLSGGAVHVWATDVKDPNSPTNVEHRADLTPVDGSYSLTVSRHRSSTRLTISECKQSDPRQRFALRRA